MSKNFELMQEAHREMERMSSSAHEPDPVLFVAVEAQRERKPGALDLDRVAKEECQKLVQRIFLTQPPSSSRAVVFAGIDPGDGCSRICAQAAQALAANTSSSVCLVEANFRTPSLPGFFGVPNHRGLADSLQQEGGIRNFIKQLKPANLWLLSSGDLNPASPALLNSERLKDRLQELRSQFDYVLLDAPALNAYADSVALGRLADGVVVVLQADSTRRESALRGLDSLREAQVEVLGAVLNRRTFPIPGFVYRRL